MTFSLIHFYTILFISHSLPSTISIQLHQNPQNFLSITKTCHHHHNSKNCRLNPNVCNIDSEHHTCCLHRHYQCTDTSRNPLHCGGCRHRCEQGKACCNGVCMDTSRDMNNCGECKRACAEWETCFNGMCGYA